MSEPLFSKHDLGAVLDNQIATAQTEIGNFEENYLLNVSETDLVKQLAAKFIIEPIQLGEAEMLPPVEADVDIGASPLWGASLHGKRHVKGHRVEIHIPFTGAPELFWCRPSSFTFNAPYAAVRGARVVLVYENPGALDGPAVRKDYDMAIGQITTYVNNIKAQCEAFNSGWNPRSITYLRRERHGSCRFVKQPRALAYPSSDDQTLRQPIACQISKEKYNSNYQE